MPKESKDKKHNCHQCGHTLTQYEVADNIYAGIDDRDYVCYSCQSEIEDIEDDDEPTPYEDTW